MSGSPVGAAKDSLKSKDSAYIKEGRGSRNKGRVI